MLLQYSIEISVVDMDSLDSTSTTSDTNVLFSDYIHYSVLLGSVAVIRGVAGYSHQTFPWMIYLCASVRRSSVQCIVEKRWIASECRLVS